MRTFLLAASVALALVAAGLIFGWGFLFLDEPGYQKDAAGWLALSAAAFALSFHPWVEDLDRRRTIRRVS